MHHTTRLRLLALRRLASLVVVASCGLLGAPLAARAVHFESGETQATLVELFTSEGCSSCPPVERWLSSLQEASGLWRSFVPVAFHVDYWDHVGWRDPYAQHRFTDRQRTYAQTWGGRPVYTPGPVRNGIEWTKLPNDKVGPVPSNVRAGVLMADSADLLHWQIKFTPDPTASGSYEVNAAPLISGVLVDVKAGENRGRQLRHDFVALNLLKQLLVPRGAAFVGNLTLAVPQHPGTNRVAIALWVTPAGQMQPLQATGGWLPAKTTGTEALRR
jgi:hypothetical protein